MRFANELSIFFNDIYYLGVFLPSKIDSLIDSSYRLSKLICFRKLYPFSVIVMHIGRACLLKVLFIYLLLNSLFATPSLSLYFWSPASLSIPLSFSSHSPTTPDPLYLSLSLLFLPPFLSAVSFCLEAIEGIPLETANKV